MRAALKLNELLPNSLRGVMKAAEVTPSCGCESDSSFSHEKKPFNSLFSFSSLIEKGRIQKNTRKQRV